MIKVLEYNAGLDVTGTLKDKMDGREWKARCSAGKGLLTESNETRYLSSVYLLSGPNEKHNDG